jgi:hypothetical protein
MTSRRIVLVALTVGTTLGALGFARAWRPDRTYVMVDDLMARRETSGDRDLEIHGWIRPGTIVHRGAMTALVLEKDGRQVHVIGDLRATDCLRDQAELVVAGQLVAARAMAGPIAELKLVVADDVVFDAVAMSCKCASMYQGRPEPLDTTFR